MSAADEPSSEHSKLVEQVLSGEKPELQMLAAGGLLPIPPRDLLRVQVVLADRAGGEIAEQAARAIADTEPKLLAQVVAEGLDSEALSWLARNLDHPLVLEAIVRRIDVPHSLLEAMAATLGPDLQETLLLRQDAIVETPTVLDALESNPELSSYSRRRIVEYRTHLLRGPEDELAAAELVPIEVEEGLSEEELETAIEAAKAEPAVGEVDQITGLSESQLRTLPLPARLKLSRRASKALRSILIRDNHPSVAVSVLQNNPMSEGEIEQVARNRAVVDDVLTAISRNRMWMRKYAIVSALVKNPRTPVGISVRLASRLSVRDLRAVAKDRNVANAVRTAAQRLYKLKLS